MQQTSLSAVPSFTLQEFSIHSSASQVTAQAVEGTILPLPFLKVWLPSKSTFTDIQLNPDKEHVSKTVTATSSLGEDSPSPESQEGDKRNSMENPEDLDTRKRDKQMSQSLIKQLNMCGM